MKLIERPEYMNKLKRLKGTPDIKIITGCRRVGKSQLLKSFITYLKESNFNANIIHIDFQNIDFDKLKNYQKLNAYIENKFIKGKENILLIDEIQLCKQYEITINSLYNSQKYDIYIIGSNAFLLNSDLATLFTGRFIQIEVFPFSFKEYCQYFNIQDNYYHHLKEYLLKGGLAGSYLYNDPEDANLYIYDIYNTIIKKDLVDRYRITDLTLLDNLCNFLMNNIGNISSINRISNILNQNKIPTNHITIGNYISYLASIFMFYKIKRYDIKGKKYLETNDKYYLVDLSFRYAMQGIRNMDYGRAYENIVALELMRRGYTIYIGKINENEVDFIAIKNSEKIYIQVSDNIESSETLKRELRPFLAIRDYYPKILLANTNNDLYDIEGIKVIDISDWLLNNKY